MFLENASRKGWIEVVCGSMFSGKTEELIRRLKRAKFAHQRVEIFKPPDRRALFRGGGRVARRERHPLHPVDSPQNILLMTADVDVVGIDEAQFFDESIVDVPPAGQQRRARDRRGSGHGLHRKAVRPDARADGNGGVRHQGSRHLRPLRQPRPPFAPPHERRKSW